MLSNTSLFVVLLVHMILSIFLNHVSKASSSFFSTELIVQILQPNSATQIFKNCFLISKLTNAISSIVYYSIGGFHLRSIFFACAILKIIFVLLYPSSVLLLPWYVNYSTFPICSLFTLIIMLSQTGSFLLAYHDFCFYIVQLQPVPILSILFITISKLCKYSSFSVHNDISSANHKALTVSPPI